MGLSRLGSFLNVRIRMAIEPASISTSPPLTLHAQPLATSPRYRDTPARGSIYTRLVGPDPVPSPPWLT